MACLIRILSHCQESTSTEQFIKNNQSIDTPNLFIETQENLTQFKVKNSNSLIKFSSNFQAGLVPKSQEFFSLNQTVPKAFIEMEGEYVVIWHLSQGNINIIIDYLDTKI